MSFVIETRAAPLRIVLFDGRAIDCTLFLHLRAEGGSGHQRVSDRLNDRRTSFLPVRVGEAVELVHLAWVAYAASPDRGEIEEQESLGARRESVELEVVGGKRLAGELLQMGRPGFERVSDVLNDGGDRFLLVWSGAETLYVQRSAIVSVRSR
ncbi:MAG TPA: hypothetical protein VMV46_02170 [Thermoanaerobaculia bacterium]|nr:hypothetical protein [Thermoanaerobaculia bacterium]